MLVCSPTIYDVIVTGNMFGDILTDEASMLPGSLGLLPSSSVTETGWGLYEPIHGSAPDIAGQGLANPIGTILSAAMLLRGSLSMPDEADIIERACSKALDDGFRTKDIQGEQPKSVTTGELAAVVIANVKAFLA
jgi:3-isopropylmalate dehydrogenase